MLLAVSTGVTNADAATRYQHAGEFGSPAEFSNPQRMAVHQGSGLVFVADRGGNRVRVYEPDANDLLTHVTDLTAASRADGADNLTEPSMIAIDQESGELYVAKTGAPAELVRFTPADPADPRSFTEDTTFTSPAGVTWAQAGGGLQAGDVRGGLAIGRDASDQPLIFAADPQADIIRAFSHSGSTAAVFPGIFGSVPTFSCLSCTEGAFADLVDLAAGPDGSLYAVDIKAEGVRLIRVARSGASYSFAREWETGLNLYPRVAVDALSHEIFVTDRERYIQIDGPGADQIAFVSDPIPMPGGANPLLATRTAVAVLGTADPTDGGRLFFGGAQFPIFGGAVVAASLQIYDSAGELAEPPVVTMDPVSDGDVGATAASLSGEITPSEEGVEWRFESRRCEEGTCEPWPAPDSAQPPWQGPIVATDYGQPQSVEFELTGLEPNSEYEVRLRATNSRASTVSDPAE